MILKAIILLLFIAVLAGAGFYLDKNRTLAPIINGPTPANTINVPINPSDTRVSATTVIYTFTGKIASVERVSAGYRLTLDNSTPDLPEFIVNNETPIFKNDGTLKQTTLDSVKNGDTVAISMSYDLKNKSWLLTTVTVPQ